MCLKLDAQKIYGAQKAGGAGRTFEGESLYHQVRKLTGRLIFFDEFRILVGPSASLGDFNCRCGVLDLLPIARVQHSVEITRL